MAVDSVTFPFGLGYGAPTPARTRGGQQAALPVILVHGYGHNHSAWHYLTHALRTAGFNEIEAMDYNPFLADIPSCGARLRAMVEQVRAATGADKVDVIGHSMGGIVARWMIEECDGWDAVRTCVTLSTPHQGAPLASFSFGSASQMRPGSAVLRRLDRDMRPSDVRWIAYYSNIDALVPGSAAKLTHPAAAAENVLSRDVGHLGVLRSAALARDIVRRLRRPPDMAVAPPLVAVPEPVPAPVEPVPLRQLDLPPAAG